jgi:hypothetical protein
MSREPGQGGCEICSKPISPHDPVVFARGGARHLVCHVLRANGRALELQAGERAERGGVQVRRVRGRDVLAWTRRLRAGGPGRPGHPPERGPEGDR